MGVIAAEADVLLPVQLWTVARYGAPSRPANVIEVRGDRYGDWLCHRDILVHGTEDQPWWEYGTCWAITYVPNGRALVGSLAEGAAREIAAVLARGEHPAVPQSPSESAAAFMEYAGPMMLAARGRHPSPCADDDDDE